MEKVNTPDVYITRETELYLTTVTRDYRRKLGQFFTPNVIKNKCYELIKNMPIPERILEPSFGTGEFILSLKTWFPSSKIYGYEIDTNLYNILKQKKLTRTRLVNKDTLLSPIKPVFDLVIGNPPYFELSKLSEKTRQRYGQKFIDIIQGRSNMYILFIKKAIEILKENGILCFVVPNSLKSSSSFSKVRDFISKTCSIIALEDLGPFSEDTSQNIMILVLKKGQSNKKFIHNGIFSLNSSELNSKCIGDEKISIFTGNVVWNQNKDKLANQGLPLVYSDNIDTKSNSLVFKNRIGEKKQYISLNYYQTFVKKGPFILISRSYSRQSGLKLCFIRDEEEFALENHVNVIVGEVKILEKIFEILKSENTLKYLQQTHGTLNLSKTQLLQIPI